MFAPAARERVQIAGSSGVFLVVAVDQERRVADLIPLSGSGFAEESVPFAVLEPYREGLSLGLGHFVKQQSSE